jgi:hypothetical protein
MKNPLPLPAVIAAIVVIVIAVLGVGFHFVQGSQPIYMNKAPSSGKGKFAAMKADTPPTTPAETPKG